MLSPGAFVFWSADLLRVSLFFFQNFGMGMLPLFGHAQLKRFVIVDFWSFFLPFDLRNTLDLNPVWSMLLPCG